MAINLTDALTLGGIAFTFAGSVWALGKSISGDFRTTLADYGRKQVEQVNVKRDIKDLLAKHSHLEGKHHQLSLNINNELSESDKRFQILEAQLYRLTGVVEGISHGRRTED